MFNNKETKFRIASLTKTFTAALFLKAVEERKVNLEDKLSQYYPEIKNAEKITMRILLNQRSGIVNFTEIDGENNWEKSFHDEREFISFFVNENSNFELDSQYYYSNTNYVMS